MITAVVSGSFKFKPEIDHTIETLEQTGISVLEPTKGWLVMPRLEIAERLSYGQIRPLPREEGLTTKEIESRFLRAIRKANLLYLVNQEGYIGNSVSLEVGYALGTDTPIYALESLTHEAMEVDDLTIRQVLSDRVTVLPPEKVAAHYTENRWNPKR
jgi:hypothetical protein